MRRLAGIAAGLIAICAAAPAHAALPPIKHVFVIWLENKDYAETFAAQSPQAPYLAKTLPAMGALLPSYYGIGHESLDNYIAAVSGQGPNPQTQSDCQFFTDFTSAGAGADGQEMGTGCVYPVSVKTIANQLEDSGRSWRGYMEDMAIGDQKTCRHPDPNQRDPTQSATADNQYAARHNPFVYFHSLIDGPSCRNYDVDLAQLTTDMSQAATTPSFSFITPDLCSDGHDDPCKNPNQKGGYGGINDFLSAWVPKILASPGYKDDGLLVVSFDEAESDNSACCGERAANTPNPAGPSPGAGGGKVGAVLVSPFIRPGTVDDTPYNHYSFLRTMEDLFGLEHLGYAGVDGLAPIGARTFNQAPRLELKVSARRMNRNHVRFAINTGRAAKIVFGGVCRGASPRRTSAGGQRTVTVRYARRGSCRITASRPAWLSSAKTFRLRAPGRRR
ncbi:MAG TPA: alkaline phosphatase family protein [Thermoleophilaceae bacterium]|nr:alkaline phosphatase family protein [Thermoleophilaceae bacterium]